MLEEVIDLSAGLGVTLLPLLLLAVPGIILVVLPPAILLTALALPLAVIAVPPYLVARWLRRRRQRGVRAEPQRVRAEGSEGLLGRA
jgi:membrane protein implicated in regulation of membrane protease activity